MKLICAFQARTVTVKGPRGSITKSFRHLKVEMKKTGPRGLLVEKWMASSKDRAAVRTVCSHISNMSKVCIKPVYIRRKCGPLVFP